MLKRMLNGVKTGARLSCGWRRNSLKKYADIHLDVKPKELEQRGGAYYSDAACSLIDSCIMTDGIYRL